MGAKLEMLARDENGSRVLSISGEVDMDSSSRVLQAKAQETNQEPVRDNQHAGG